MCIMALQSKNDAKMSILNSLPTWAMRLSLLTIWIWRILHFALHKMLKGHLASAFYLSFFICVCLEAYIIVNDKPGLLKSSYPVNTHVQILNYLYLDFVIEEDKLSKQGCTLIPTTASETRTFNLYLTRVFQNHFNYWNENFTLL